jgi:hypothetical protein
MNARKFKTLDVRPILVEALSRLPRFAKASTLSGPMKDFP